MMLHKKSILLVALLLVLAMAWAVSANSLVDQRSVLAGRVVAQDLVTAGARVKEGAILVEVTSITGSAPAARATVDGVVQEVLVKPGDMVHAGDVLARIQPAVR